MLLALDMRGALENLYILGALEPTKLTQLSRWVGNQRVLASAARGSADAHAHV